MPWLVVQKWSEGDDDSRTGFLWESEEIAKSNAQWLGENGREYHEPIFFNSIQFNDPNTF